MECPLNAHVFHLIMNLNSYNAYITLSLYGYFISFYFIAIAHEEVDLMSKKYSLLS